MTNSGDRRGVAVPQLYLVAAVDKGCATAPEALKGFKRLALAPGKAKRVRFTLSKRAFSYWSVRKHGWQVVSGCARVLVGSSSRKTPLKDQIAPTGAC